ncbi:MAG: radical SAM protein [Candidatus Krumholzibacteria bacterium]|nr:radical SAM protein [Candidatus Krumholzibacteria bacterium]
MKALFLNPPRFHELVGKNPSVIEHNRGYNPPLGILALATSVKKFTGDKHSVEVLDCQPRQLTHEQMEAYFEENSFDVVGITAMTFTLIDVIMIARTIKRTNPECKVVLGGPHVHIYPEETINLECVDYLIQGEGELAILDFLEALEGKRSFLSVPGIVYKDNGQVVNNGIAPKIPDLDQVPYPDRRLLPIEHYGSLLGRHNLTTTMFTSRGCPFRCTFCDRPMSPTISGFRWRSAQHVVDELEEIVGMGISEVLIYDDTFSVRKDRVLEICDEILSRGVKVTWDVRAHVNTVNADLLKRMKQAGCDRIHYGVESGNDRMLKVIKKNTKVKRVKQTFAETRKAGIEALAYFMIGQQTETQSDILDTMQLAKDLKPDYCHFTIFCPYPATEIYETGLARGFIKEDVWRNFSKDPHPGFQLPVWEENFTREELYEWVVKCYKSFYSRPGYALRRLARVRRFGELKRKVRAGLAVLMMKPDEVDKLDLRKATKVE